MDPLFSLYKSSSVSATPYFNSVKFSARSHQLSGVLFSSRGSGR